MSSPALTWLRQRGRLCRWVAVAFALACQISAGASVPMRDAVEAQSRLAASVAVFCQSGAHPVKQDGAPHHRQVPDHGLCQMLSAHGHAAAVLEDAVFLSAPGVIGTAGAALPRARAPPARFVATCFPRGPPRSV